MNQCCNRKRKNKILPFKDGKRGIGGMGATGGDTSSGRSEAPEGPAPTLESSTKNFSRKPAKISYKHKSLI